MRFINKAFIITVSLCLLSFIPASTYAAQFHSGQALDFSPTDQLNNAYIAGSQIHIDSPVSNDLVVAGSEVTINGTTEKALLAAAGTLTINGSVGQNARLAGGTVTVNSHISGDLIVAGGTIIVSSKAVIDGDLVILGGTVTINGPVAGKVILKAGQATINSSIGSLANSQVDQLSLGSKTIVAGNLSYQSTQEAQIDKSAIIKGQIDFQKKASQQTNWVSSGAFSAFGFFYGLVSSLIFCAVLLFLGRKISLGAVELVQTKVWPTIAWGFTSIFLFPILAAILTALSVWLGIASFMLYALCLIFGFFLAELLLGWWLLQWWFGRTKETYKLDWRAVVIGVFASTIIMLVPIIGWSLMAIMMLLAMGSLAQLIWNLRLK